jgi:hypothetical protein
MPSGDQEWFPVEYGPQYHGQIRCPDGRSFWVFACWHREAGPCVEVRDGSRDGRVVHRIWCPHASAAHDLVATLRDDLGRATLEVALPSRVVPAPSHRVPIVLHGPQHGKGRVSWLSSIDDEPVGRVCSPIFVEPRRVTAKWWLRRWGISGPVGEVRQVGALEVDLVAPGPLHCLLSRGRTMELGSRPPRTHRGRYGIFTCPHESGVPDEIWKMLR